MKGCYWVQLSHITYTYLTATQNLFYANAVDANAPQKNVMADVAPVCRHNDQHL